MSGAALLGVGLGAIEVESCAMTLAVHKVNHDRGSLPRTFLATLALSVLILLALVPLIIAHLTALLFLFPAWVCAKIQLSTTNKMSTGRQARSGSK